MRSNASCAAHSAPEALVRYLPELPTATRPA